MPKRPGDTYLSCPPDRILADRQIRVHEIAAKRIAGDGDDETWSWKADLESLAATDGRVDITIKFLDDDGFELGNEWNTARLEAGRRHVYTGIVDHPDELARRFRALGCEVTLHPQDGDGAVDVEYREVGADQFLDG